MVCACYGMALGIIMCNDIIVLILIVKVSIDESPVCEAEQALVDYAIQLSSSRAPSNE